MMFLLLLFSPLARAGDVIWIDPGTYYGPLVLSASNVQIRGQGLPVFNGTLTITGANNTIDGIRFTNSVLITGPRTIVQNSVFVNCSSKTNGGALNIQNTADLVNVSVIGSNAVNFGGAVYSTAALNVVDCKFMNNSALRGGLYTRPRPCVLWMASS